MERDSLARCTHGLIDGRPRLRPRLWTRASLWCPLCRHHGSLCRGIFCARVTRGISKVLHRRATRSFDAGGHFSIRLSHSEVALLGSPALRILERQNWYVRLLTIYLDYIHFVPVGAGEGRGRIGGPTSFRPVILLRCFQSTSKLCALFPKQLPCF